jgi:hypothetical protein
VASSSSGRFAHALSALFVPKNCVEDVRDNDHRDQPERDLHLRGAHRRQPIRWGGARLMARTCDGAANP